MAARFCALALPLIVAATVPASAQPAGQGAAAPPVAQGQNQTQPAAPPFSFAGWRHELLGNATQTTHMNICAHRSCQAGSRMSYQVYAPKPGLTFEQYKAERKQIETALAAQVKDTRKLEFAPPTESKGPIFRVLEAKRFDAYPDGRKQVVISRRYLAEKVSIDFISTAGDEQAALQNLTLFEMGAMIVVWQASTVANPPGG